MYVCVCACCCQVQLQQAEEEREEEVGGAGGGGWWAWAAGWVGGRSGEVQEVVEEHLPSGGYIRLLLFIISH